METPSPAPLTPEQFAAINAGAGHAQLIDPTTQVVYHVFQQPSRPTVDDEYVRTKLAEAQADVDSGKIADWNVDELKQELRQRLAKKQSQN
jgi:hypothetical protein